MYTLAKSHQAIHLRVVRFTICKLDLNKELLKFKRDVISFKLYPPFQPTKLSQAASSLLKISAFNTLGLLALPPDRELPALHGDLRSSLDGWTDGWVHYDL